MALATGPGPCYEKDDAEQRDVIQMDFSKSVQNCRTNVMTINQCVFISDWFNSKMKMKVSCGFEL